MKHPPSHIHTSLVLAVLFVSVYGADLTAPPAAPKSIVTPWAAQVGPATPLPDYPRPQLQRETWINLNGTWDYAIRPRETTFPPASYDGKILVPFAVESQLGGPQKTPGPDQRLWYHRTFEIPESARGKRLLLHFGAVNWQTDVWVNGKQLARHEGGYDPFTFNITDLLVPGQPQEILLAVWNPVDTGAQPRGKQTLNPANIFYTSVTGIWQTVWLESVPSAYVQGVRIEPDLDKASVSFSLKVTGSRGAKAVVRILSAGQEVAKTEVTSFDSLIDYCSLVEVKVPSPHAWSPGDPFLYDVEITYTTPRSTDTVKSYFGFRKIERKVAADGYERIFLNGKPLFLYGPLDQGWWPDGLYTAPTDEALRWDIETMKKMGFNMVRKHVKVEPARWYYHCDKLGLLVWQDMPSGMQDDVPNHVPPRQQPLDGIMAPVADAQFRRELTNMIENRRHFCSIIAWVPFNECWGQHNTNEILASVKQIDLTRLVDGPSGWNDLGFGDMIDKHDYPGPSMYASRVGRVSVLGEFGGLGLPIMGHLWQQDKNWGYRDFGSADEMTKQYEALLDKLHRLIEKGLAAAVYTQLTDVETEVNGLVTYDREIIKIPVGKLAELHRGLTESPKIPMRDTPRRSPVEPLARTSTGLVDRQLLLNQQVKELGTRAKLVFIGDSITEWWQDAGKDVWARYYAPRHAINLGIAGDATEHVLWRLDHGNLDGLMPKVAVLLIGTNNLGDDGDTPEEVATGVTAVVQKLRARLPETKILLLAIFPREYEPHAKLAMANQVISRLADDEHVFWLDLSDRLLGSNGTISPDIMPDGLHLSSKGYQIWAEAMEPKLSALMDESPK